MEIRPMSALPETRTSTPARALGRSGLTVSPICLGTMTWGTQNSQAEAHSQLDAARAAGINFIDTAEMYSVPSDAESYGKTESIIGHWLKRQPRDAIVLATKIAGSGRAMPWIRGGRLAFDRASLTSALENSLRRLQTDYVDLYQLHWPVRNVPMFGGYQFDPAQERDATPIRETLEGLAELVEAGKIRAVGLSNETPWGVMQFARLADEYGLPRVASVQNAYNLLNRTWEQGLAEIGYREQIALLPYSVLGFGLLSGKYLDNPAADGRVTRFKGFAQRYSKPGVAPAVAEYVALARRHGLSPALMAQAFVASRWFVGSTIIGATSLVQLEENIRACRTTLSEEVLRGIEEIHLRHSTPAP
jgi:aryl-alcohol dehydrogenase-like predicted oxidoreductase